MDRRTFLSVSVATAAGLVLPGCRSGGDRASSATSAPPPEPSTTTTSTPPAALGAPDGNGLRLLPGFTSRVIATSGVVVAGTDLSWHLNPDGGACFATDWGGWIYVSNSESVPGGASSVRFAADGTVIAAHRILEGTTRNCAGGATPWGSWLSCEEHPGGAVWECDPNGVGEPVRHPSMGIFQHEAACAHPPTQTIYLTEDEPDGCVYRYTPDVWGQLASGRLEVMMDGDGGAVAWATVPDPQLRSEPAVPTREQVPGARRFNGGEGTCLLGEAVAFTTKGDDRVWRYDPAGESLTVLYDAAQASSPILTGVDNCIALDADLFVCEDPGDLEIVRIRPDGSAQAVVQVTGAEGSEVAGVAFSPDGRRMYFSSQRAPGVTYEVEGPW